MDGWGGEGVSRAKFRFPDSLLNVCSLAAHFPPSLDFSN